MLPQYIIMLGSRATSGSRPSNARRFEENDYRVMEKIVREVHGFEGCTIIRARGLYRGHREDTAQIIILADNYDRIKACARELRRTFRQQSVLVISAGVGEFLT